MSLWKNVRVRTKLLSMVGGFSLALILIGTMGLLSVRSTGSNVGTLSDNMEEVAQLADMKNRFLAMRLDLVYMLALQDTAKVEAKEQSFIKNAEELAKSLADLEKHPLTADKKEKLQAFKEGLSRYLVEGKKLADLAKVPGGKAEAADFATTSVAPLYDKPAKAIADLVESDIQRGHALKKDADAAYRHSFELVIGLLLVVVASGTVVGIAIANSVSRPLAKVLATLDDVAGGNLTARSDIDSRDEMGQLARGVNTMADRIHGIILQVASSTTQVASAATELYSTAEQMATGAEEVAAQTGTVATAGEQMAATSGEIAQNCTMAAQGSTQANDAAAEGAAVVQETVKIMQRIAERVRTSAQTVESLGTRSDQIGAIIGTIEDIADQTNLLALNAAIEAARAGEQGRGFAVVADEVRALAERTTRATKEISEMIKAIQQDTRGAVAAMDEGVREVESGTVEATRSGEALGSILDQIGNVTSQVSQIATAAEQQTATTGEISSNIQQITEVVQQTAKGAHESATAASQLAQLANDLEHIVRQFKLAA